MAVDINNLLCVYHIFLDHKFAVKNWLSQTQRNLFLDILTFSEAKSQPKSFQN